MSRRQSLSWVSAGTVLWVALVGGAALIGRAAHDRNSDTPTGTAPFFGRYDVDISWGIIRPLILATVLIALWPPLCRKLQLRFLLPLSAAVSTAWAVTVATLTDFGDLVRPIENRHDYLPAVELVSSPGRFVDTFVENYDSFPVHVKGHPPLAVLAFWVLDQIGLGGAKYATWLVLAVASLAAPAVIYIAASLGGVATARRVAVFAGLTPGVLMVASSIDAAIMGVVAVTAAAATASVTAKSDSRSVAFGFLTGLLAATAVYLSYGAPLLLASSVPLGLMLIRDRRFASIGAMVGGAGLVALAFTVNGFWLLEGLDITRQAYREGIATRRPYSLFVWLNLAALLAMVGPIPLAGALKKANDWRRDRTFANPVQWLAVAALTGALAANVSGLSKGEVERIWLPFVPFLALAAAPFARTQTAARVGLGLQFTVTIGLQVIWRSPW